MSVMAETSQSAIGPYVAMAALGLALYAWTAVCREALLVKVPGGGGDGDGGGGENEVSARSSGKNCGGAALKRTREPGFNERSLLPLLSSVPLRLAVKHLRTTVGAHMQ